MHHDSDVDPTNTHTHLCPQTHTDLHTQKCYVIACVPRDGPATVITAANASMTCAWTQQQGVLMTIVSNDEAKMQHVSLLLALSLFPPVDETESGQR